MEMLRQGWSRRLTMLVVAALFVALALLEVLAVRCSTPAANPGPRLVSWSQDVHEVDEALAGIGTVC